MVGVFPAEVALDGHDLTGQWVAVQTSGDCQSKGTAVAKAWVKAGE